MEAVKPSSVQSMSSAVGAAPGSKATASGETKTISEADHLLKSLELELARKRAERQAQSGNNRGSLRALSVLMLLVLLGAAFYALWQLQTLHDNRRPMMGAPTTPSSVAAPADNSQPPGR